MPAVLTRGGAVPDRDTPWWRMRELFTLVERDFGRFAPLVSVRWDAFESCLGPDIAAVEDEARRRSGPSRAALLTDRMQHMVAAYLDETDALVREIAAA